MLQAFLLAAVVLGSCGLFYLTRGKRKVSRRVSFALGATITVGLVGLMVGTPQIAEHYLLIYGALLILFLITMPRGMAGFLSDIRGLWFRSLPGPSLRPVSSPQPQAASVLPASTQPREALTIREGRMNFGGVKALDGVSLTVQPGTVHGLIGPNGSGKSTLVNIVTGVYVPSGGEIQLGDRRIDGLSPSQIARLGVARTFQNIQLFKDLSVLDNVMMGFHKHRKATFLDEALRTRRYVREDRFFRAVAFELLDFLEIRHLAEEEAQSLPYGLQRLVEIARALATSPAILLLDEPAAGINPSEITRLTQVIKRIKDAGVTVLVIEHHMELVMGASDQITVLDYGRKIADGPAAEIQCNPRVIDAYLGSSNHSFAELRRTKPTSAGG